MIYLKFGFYIPAFAAHLSAWLAPKCYLALSALIESVLSCLGGPAAFLSSVSKVPLHPPPTSFTPSSRCAYLFVLGELGCCSERRGEERRGPAGPTEGHRLPLASCKVERAAVGGDPL